MSDSDSDFDDSKAEGRDIAPGASLTLAVWRDEMRAMLFPTAHNAIMQGDTKVSSGAAGDWFEIVSSVFTLASIICLAVDDPLSPPESFKAQILDKLDVLFVIFFCLELPVRVICFGGRKFLQDNFNRLDVIVVALGIIGLSFKFNSASTTSLAFFRDLRALRPLRTFSRVSRVQAMLSSLWSSLLRLRSAAVAFGGFILIAAVVAITPFSGRLQYRCVNDVADLLLPHSNPPIRRGLSAAAAAIEAQNMTTLLRAGTARAAFEAALRTKTTSQIVTTTFTECLATTPARLLQCPWTQKDFVCGSTWDQAFVPSVVQPIYDLCDADRTCTPYDANFPYRCPWGYTCQRVGNPMFGMQSFDNVFYSTLTSFTLVTRSNMETYHKIADATSEFAAFFCAYMMLLGRYCFVAIIIAVSTAEFRTHQRKKAQRAAGAREFGAADDGFSRILRRFVALIGRAERAVDAENTSTGCEIEDELIHFRRFDQWDWWKYSSQRCMSAAEYERGIEIQAKLDHDRLFHSGPVRRRRATVLVRRIVGSQALWVTEIAISLAVLIACGSVWYPLDRAAAAPRTVLIVCYLVWIASLSLRLIAHLPHVVLFFRRQIHIFEVIAIIGIGASWIVHLTSLVDSPFETNPFKAFFLIRAFSLMRDVQRRWPRFARINKAIVTAAPDCITLLVMIALFVVMFACGCMQFFGGQFCNLEDEEPSNAVSGVAMVLSGKCNRNRNNFDSFFTAIISSFAVISGDNWDFLMYQGMRSIERGSSYAIATVGAIGVAILFVGMFMALSYCANNLFIAILLNARASNDDALREEARVMKQEEVMREHLRQRIKTLESGLDSRSLQRFGRETMEGARRAVTGFRRRLPPIASRVLTSSRRGIFALQQARVLPVCHLVLVVATIVGQSFVLPTSSPMRGSYIAGRSIVLHCSWLMLIVEVLEMLPVAPSAPPRKWADWLRSLYTVASACIGVANSPFSLDSAAGRATWILVCLRPMLLVYRSEQLKTAWHDLMGVLSDVAHILFMCAVAVVVWAMFGVMLFGGCFGRCANSAMTTVEACAANNSTWVNLPVNFDNPGPAAVAVIALTTFSNWTHILYAGVDSVGPGEAMRYDGLTDYNPRASLYFIFFLITGGILLVDLIAMTLIDSREMRRFRVETLLQHEDRSALLSRHRCDTQEQLVMALGAPIVARASRHGRVNARFRTLERWSGGVVAFLAFIVACAEYDGISQFWQDFMYNCNIVFAVFFVGQVCMQLVLLGKHLDTSGPGTGRIVTVLRGYFSQTSWNTFDVYVAVISVIYVIVSATAERYGLLWQIVHILAIFRVLRMGKGAAVWREIGIVALRLRGALTGMFNIVLLIFLCIVCFALIGIHLFARVQFKYPVLDSRVGFRDLPASIWAMMRVLTLDNWTVLMVALSVSPVDGACDDDIGLCGNSLVARIFFTGTAILFGIIFSYMLIAVFVEAFSTNTDSVTESLTLTAAEINTFAAAFVRQLDADRDFMMLPAARVLPLLESIDETMHMVTANDDDTVRRSHPFSLPKGGVPWRRFETVVQYLARMNPRVHTDEAGDYVDYWSLIDALCDLRFVTVGKDNGAASGVMTTPQRRLLHAAYRRIAEVPARIADKFESEVPMRVSVVEVVAFDRAFSLIGSSTPAWGDYCAAHIRS